MKNDLSQIRLTNGSEIVCEVMEWPEKNENQMIIRNAMAIIVLDFAAQDATADSHVGERAFVFRPWCSFVEDSMNYILVNSDHIISINNPTEYLVENYYIAVRDAHKQHIKRTASLRKEKLESLQALAEQIEKVVAKREEKKSTLPDNVILFPDIRDWDDDDDPTVH